MPELPPRSLSAAREQKINELSQHFANDDLSLDELERRIEQVYKATNVAELDVITADLRQAMNAAPVPSVPPNRRASVAPSPDVSITPGYDVERSRILAIMSSTRRIGRWAVPRQLGILALMSDTKIDLTHAALPVGGVVDVHVNAIMAQFKLIVPPGVRVINQMHSIMADVRSSADDLPPEGAPTGVPIIRFTGTAFMAEVRVQVRRREDPLVEDDDEG